MPIFPKPYADLVQKLRVPIGLVVAAGFGWFAHPTTLSLLAGLPLQPPNSGHDSCRCQPVCLPPQPAPPHILQGCCRGPL